MEKEMKFKDAKTSVIIRLKTIQQQAFIFRSAADIPNLIKFVGSSPKLQLDKAGNLQIAFKKHEIKEGSVILRNSFGEVTNVLSYEDAERVYDIVAESEFKPEHSNKVIEKKKIVKEKK